VADTETHLTCTTCSAHQDAESRTRATSAASGGAAIAAGVVLRKDIGSPTVADVVSVADRDDEEDQHVIVDVVDDPVVAVAVALERSTASQI